MRTKILISGLLVIILLLTMLPASTPPEPADGYAIVIPETFQANSPQAIAVTLFKGDQTTSGDVELTVFQGNKEDTEKGQQDMPRPVHFEISADDPERAVAFYEKTFGWKVEKWAGPMDYWMIMTGAEGEPGIDGGLAKRQSPGQNVTNTIDVDSVDAYVDKVIAAGGKVVLPKQAIPGVGYLAYCADTEGNVFGLMKSDPNAA